MDDVACYSYVIALLLGLNKLWPKCYWPNQEGNLHPAQLKTFKNIGTMTYAVYMS